MKKRYFILIVFVVAFLLFFAVFGVRSCFAAETETTENYSLSTNFYLETGVDRQEVNIIINHLDNRYVVFPVFYLKDYYPTADYNYSVNCFLGMYDKTEDIIYLAGRSNSEAEFINNFIKNQENTITFKSGVADFKDSRGFLWAATNDIVDNFNVSSITSNNYKLPYSVLSLNPVFSSFGLNDIINKGGWFSSGNNYPFSNNSVYSADIYYPLTDGFQHFLNKYQPDYTIRFGLSEGNVQYPDLNNYYLEIWTSSLNDNNLVFQSQYKITDILHTWISTDGKLMYTITDDFYKIFPQGTPYVNFTVFMRCRYVQGDVNLVSSYQYYLQQAYMTEDPKISNVYQVDGLLPGSQVPDTTTNGSFNANSQSGSFNFGEFNALEFVKGGGGLASLTQGVSTVFSFLPSWLWQMMWYILGALAVIALLKVIIS